MADAIRLLATFVLAAFIAGVATPIFRELAVRCRFYDEPTGYKEHLRPTPYLGGAAVIAAFGLAVAPFGTGFGGFGWLLACSFALAAVGTLDDRLGLPILPRLTAGVAVAVVLWATGQGWEIFAGDAANLILTVVWVVGLINAFNLMDNLDGAAASVASVCAAGAGGLAAAEGNLPLAAVAFAMAGACAGFLPFNLAKPSRIFLGDGGSMPIGFVVAAAVMGVSQPGDAWTSALAWAPLVALPIFDTALVIVSRYRRRTPILKGGRDHLSHRLFAYLGSERSVALVLASVQAPLCGVALALHDSGPPTVIAAISATALAATLALAALETQRLAPARMERAG
jgi:UDP-GlcNAc:undecaprenyl-phosphate GlcNAc-1-phosphate transferase